jgi:hypothetical protein
MTRDRDDVRSATPAEGDGVDTPEDQRRRRLADALRANLRKRKEQARARRSSDGGDGTRGIAFEKEG